MHCRLVSTFACPPRLRSRKSHPTQIPTKRHSPGAVCDVKTCCFSGPQVAQSWRKEGVATLAMLRWDSALTASLSHWTALDWQIESSISTRISQDPSDLLYSWTREGAEVRGGEEEKKRKIELEKNKAEIPGVELRILSWLGVQRHILPRASVSIVP